MINIIKSGYIKYVKIIVQVCPRPVHQASPFQPEAYSIARRVSNLPFCKPVHRKLFSH